MLLPSDILGVDHIRIPAPKGSEKKARWFYGEVLGMEEVPPGSGRRRGACRFRCGASDLLIEARDDFEPQTEARPALAVSSVHAVRARLLRAKMPNVGPVEETGGRAHVTADDPFGNRLEFTEPSEAAAHRTTVPGEYTPPKL